MNQIKNSALWKRKDLMRGREVQTAAARSAVERRSRAAAAGRPEPDWMAAVSSPAGSS